MGCFFTILIVIVALQAQLVVLSLSALLSFTLHEAYQQVFRVSEKHPRRLLWDLLPGSSKWAVGRKI